MSDETLKQQIASLAGAINRHKKGREEANSKEDKTLQHVRKRKRPVTRHLSLNTSTSEGAWVKKQDSKHMQLINAAVYEEHAQRQLQHRQLLDQAKKRRKEEREAAKARHMAEVARKRELREMDVDGIRFRVAAGGSQLRRIKEAANASLATPRRVVIAGVTFLRSRNGNLLRYGLVKSKAIPCRYFALTGQCTRAQSCSYTHDPTRVAICPQYLRDKCDRGAFCNLSHEARPERVPTCIHFLHGSCSNDACRYAHVHVNAAAPVCRAFALAGYCGQGSSCHDRHVRECPQFAATGKCDERGCKLPHVLRAGKTKTRELKGNAKKGEEEEEEEEEEGEISEVDSEAIDFDGRSLADEHDFVHL